MRVAITAKAITVAALFVVTMTPMWAETVATPKFEPAPKNFERDIKVAITSTTKDAVIRYTTNGYDPSSSSTQYKGPITLTQSTTLKARALKTGMSDSSVATGVYKQLVATPKFSVSPGSSLDAPLLVKIECATSGAKIRYTLTGYDPNSSSPEYKGPLTLMDTVTVKARAYKDNMAESAIAMAKYTETNPDVAPVTFSPDPSKVYDARVTVELACRTPQAVIRYTLDGADPTATSPECKGDLLFIGNTALKARAFKVGKKDSPVAKAEYRVRALPPVFKPGSGSAFTDPMKVTLESPLPKGEIRYSLTATEPTTSALLYKEPFELANTTTVKARVYIEGMEPSVVANAEYEELHPDLPPVLFDNTLYKVGDGYIEYFETVKIVKMVCNANGTPPEIRYTLTGTDPTESSLLLVGGRIVLPGTAHVRARAFKAGKTPSPVTGGTFVKKEKVLEPYFTPSPNIFKTTTDVIIKCDTDGAEIRYTLDESEPTKYSPVYDGQPIVVKWTTTIRALALKLNWVDSPVVTGNFEIRHQIQN
jgi:hypothetical protein